MEAEQRLAAYRAKKRREEHINKVAQSVQSFFTFPRLRYKMTMINVDEQASEQHAPLLNEKHEEMDLSDSESEDIECCVPTYITIITYILYFVLWITLYLIFLKLQFGLVYLVTSALIGIYLNTRTSKRKKNEISAYSVFNKNCESIDGTLKAEQFEREIRMGPVAFR
ncbi:hypothetical protein RN001_000642 [Aquatica leii]|uniref:SAYSvFN domain-containing protein n=1 Tax=Aquatica leii TaxID=1421715 RepID=A0AAN7SCC0_9COLE|nr:hypothetical protein RN001_000642 [Aquatica leii]